ncbi:MAG: copper ion binding protein, partial [Kofleriaceae bacterium]
MTAVAGATEQVADLVVQGMTCASCVRRVERALTSTPGVREATVNFATSQARIAYDPTSATRDALVAAIEQAGYEVPRLEPARTTAELAITGMTCAACVRRIEKALRAVPGVHEATVNLVTERATVQLDPAQTTVAALVAAVESAGYGATDATTPSEPTGADARTRADALAESEEREQRSIRRDFAIAALLTVPLLVVAMSHGAIPGTEGPFGRWLQLAL